MDWLKKLEKQASLTPEVSPQLQIETAVSKRVEKSIPLPPTINVVNIGSQEESHYLLRVVGAENKVTVINNVIFKI